MRVLITGACGFVGRHLAHDLVQHGHEVVLASHEAREVRIGEAVLPATPCDMRDAGGLRALVDKAAPDAVVHLAGLAQTIMAAADRANLSAINTLAVHHLCAAVAARKASQVPLLFVSSSFVYGNDYTGTVAVSETTPPRPNIPYGHSKLAAEHIGRLFEDDFLSFYVVRPFNHIGPGQSTSFVCPGFAQRLIATPAGGTIDVGNLSARRDFSDVRDIVRAYRLILERRPPARLFVLGSGRSVTIADILAKLVDISGKNIKSQVKPELYRENDECDMLANNALAEAQLDWRCEIPLEQSLADVYDDVERHAKMKE